MSNAESVKEFTEGMTGNTCPNKPIPLTKDDALFIVRMVMSELDELICTVSTTEDERDKLMQQSLDTRDKCKNFSYNNELELVSAQADAMVDSWYYMLNVASKHGMNLSKLFDVIHNANMAKRDPDTGKFIRRESDGKVIKPDGWQPPDIEGEMQKQMDNGSW